MDIQDIKQVIIDQKNDLKNILSKENIIERETLQHFKKHIESNLIKVILGIRRCGKSTLAYQLLLGKKFAYINFDDERIAYLETDDLNKVLESFYEVYGKFKYIFFDEIQNVLNWELFANRVHRQGFNLVITGSNAKLLSRELATHLTGRHIPFELFPFSFNEFLIYDGLRFDLKLLKTKDRGLIKGKFNNYVKKGGFPETLNEEIISETYLRSLYATIIDKDVILRKRVRYIKTLKDISNYLISNCSCQISFNKIKNIFNLRSVHTALNYVSHLEEAYIIFLIKRLSYKYKESLIANRKVYVIDTGFIHALSLKFSNDKGKIYENIVAIELLRKKALQSIEIYYWQDNNRNEVDFVIKNGLRIKQLIQVCYNINEFNTKKREIKSLIKASKELKCNNLLIITDDKEGEELVNKKKINYIPLWKWLLY